MKVKTKITLGLVFLFTVIVGLSLISIYYLNSLNVQNQDLLQDNYRSLHNLHGLQRSLNEIRNSFEPEEDSRVRLKRIDYRLDPAIASFEMYLSRQQEIPASGEESLINEVESGFEALKKFIKVTRTKDYYFERLVPLIADINQMINQLYLLNEQAIEHRNEVSKVTAQRVIYTVAAIVAFCIVIAFSFMVGFPRFVAEPVEKLSEAIEKIKKGDYGTRVEIESRDEFGALGTAFNEMTQRLEEYERLNLSKIMTEKKRIETMVQKISEGIIGLDADFNVIFINPFAKRALGFDNEEISGRSLKDLALKNDLTQSVISDLLDHSTSGKRYIRNKLIKGKTQDKPAYFIRKVILTYDEKDPEKELNGYILMLKNITEYKELDEARTNFIATVSHELKTPISAIKMSLKLLKDRRLSDLTKEQTELVEDVEWEVSRLLNITQELLNANEAESGKIQLQYEYTTAKEVLEEAVDSVLTLAEDRGITIIEDMEHDLPSIYVDENKLTWVVINFLTNAIKYSPVDSEVKLAVQREDDKLRIAVEDQGKGIAPAEQKKIFDRYYRIPDSEGKGTGLGLSISKEIIQQMNGSIGVKSEVGKGSLFYVTLHNVFKKETV